MFDLIPFKRCNSALPGTFADMDEMLRRLWSDFPFHNMREDMDITWSPRIDVSETDKGLEIVADLSGLKNIQ